MAAVERLAWEQRLEEGNGSVSASSATPPSSAVVFCAAPGCDHLDCHGGRFRVALVGTDEDVTLASVYSSETASLDTGSRLFVSDMRVSLVGDEIYFILGNCDAIGEYGWARNCLSVANPSPPVEYGHCALMEMEDGSLGLSGIEDSSLYLWSRKVNSKGAAEWVQCRVIDLKTVVPVADPAARAFVIGFAEGVGVIFVSTDVGVFTFELKSGRVRKVDDPGFYYSALPYLSFYTPGTSVTLSQWVVIINKDSLIIEMPRSSKTLQIGQIHHFESAAGGFFESYFYQ
ncbi:uncharacterized protein [Setaria viridis]|uniref:uncharacterized protein n=1 Tax=Setaria viridis TaxID=4556 RepID=UPI0014938516|nr:uncharacterized protein LOC117843040 [Setaria viridis]